MLHPFLKHLVGRSAVFIPLRLQMGIVGLPNVGKSTLFNVLTKLSIPAENFPFCTIEPNQVCVVLWCGQHSWYPEVAAAHGSGSGSLQLCAAQQRCSVGQHWQRALVAMAQQGQQCQHVASSARLCMSCDGCRGSAWAAVTVLLSHRDDTCAVVGLLLLLLLLGLAGSRERSR